MTCSSGTGRTCAMIRVEICDAKMWWTLFKIKLFLGKLTENYAMKCAVGKLRFQIHHNLKSHKHHHTQALKFNIKFYWPKLRKNII